MDVQKKREILKELVNSDKSIIDLIVEMKDLASLAIDLGFSALLLQDKKLAEKTVELEEEMDLRQYQIQAKCMMAASSPKESIGLVSVLRMASAVEDISNAVKELTDIILKGIPPHPIIAEALKSASRGVDYIKVRKDSKIVGKTMKEVTAGKATVIGLKRNEVWEYLPKVETRIEGGDTVVVSGKTETLNDILKEFRK